jgi:hypothetical protein
VCVGQEESQSLQPKGVVEKTAIAGECVESKNSNTWKYLKNYRKECVQELS